MNRWNVLIAMVMDLQRNTVMGAAEVAKEATTEALAETAVVEEWAALNAIHVMVMDTLMSKLFGMINKNRKTIARLKDEKEKRLFLNYETRQKRRELINSGDKDPVNCRNVNDFNLIAYVHACKLRIDFPELNKKEILFKAMIKYPKANHNTMYALTKRFRAQAIELGMIEECNAI